VLRLGLCCLFLREPIRCRTTTAKALRPLRRKERLARVSALCLNNVASLKASVEAVTRLGIGAFRIQSGLFPRATHPEVGYRLEELPDRRRILALAAEVRALAKAQGIRLSFHPDQFVVLSSARPEVVDSSLRELEFQGLQAELFGAEVINIHGGGAEGGKAAALARFKTSFRRLSLRVRRRLSLENDDRVYTPRDLLPLCRELGVPLVYDAHHHRCLPDGLSVSAATRAAAATWKRLGRARGSCSSRAVLRGGDRVPGGREPYFHISSPRAGWRGGDPRPHADYIDPRDFPKCWLRGRVTVDVEAKAKELAILRLRGDLGL
jgi:UV DNA damage endonuclease